MTNPLQENDEDLGESDAKTKSGLSIWPKMGYAVSRFRDGTESTWGVFKKDGTRLTVGSRLTLTSHMSSRCCLVATDL